MKKVLLLVSAFILLSGFSGCGCTDYEDCQRQWDGDYECYAPTCPLGEDY